MRAPRPGAVAMCAALRAPLGVPSIGRAQSIRVADALASAESHNNAFAAFKRLDNSLEIIAHQAMAHWVYAADRQPAAVRIDVTVTYLGGPTNGGYGISFGRHERSSGQTWCDSFITTLGEFKLLCGGKDVIPWRHSDALVQGEHATNLISVELIGHDVVLYANHIILERLSVDRDLSGFIGVHQVADMDLEWANLNVVNP